MSQLAYNYLIKLLSARDYSEHKLREKLKLKKYSVSEIDAAIDEVKTKGYLREEAYSEARIKAFMNKGYSVNYIRQKLNQEHLKASHEQIHEVFDENDSSEAEQIKKLLAKKLKNISQDKEEAYKERQKAVRFALSKGHNPGMVFKILKTSFNGQDVTEGLESEF